MRRLLPALCGLLLAVPSASAQPDSTQAPTPPVQVEAAPPFEPATPEPTVAEPVASEPVTTPVDGDAQGAVPAAAVPGDTLRRRAARTTRPAPAPPDPEALLLAQARTLRPDSTDRPDALPALLRGVVWTPSDSTALDLRDLVEMQRAGVRAVKTRPIRHEALLTAADRLGLILFQDMPVADLPADRLVAETRLAARELDSLLARAARHPSVRYVGLANMADTSEPAACAYFDRLAERVRSEGPEGMRTYYTSRFANADRCADSVDLVLLDARSDPPAPRLARWRVLRGDQPAGIVLGQAVRPGEEGGYLERGTEASQGRYLEEQIAGLTGLSDGADGAFFAGLDVPPAALFLYRWRDSAADAAPLSAGVSRMDFGLRDEMGRPRPSLAVASGYFTGQQRTFAFDAGDAPSGGAPSLLAILAALSIVGLVGLYARGGEVNLLAERYFFRHGLYQEAVRRGRELDATTSAALAGCLALAAGVLTTVALRTLARTDALALTLAPLAEGTREGIVTLLTAPVGLALLVTAIYALWLVLLMVGLFALTGKDYRIRPQQAITLAVWPRWPLLVLMLGALLVATMPAGLAAARWAVALLTVWAVVEVVALARTLGDFGAVSGVPTERALGIGLLVPLGLAVALGAAVAWAVGPELSFLWHVATRS